MEITKELIPFQFKGSPVDIIRDQRGDPWWIAKQVCAILKFSENSRPLRSLDTEDKATVPIQHDSYKHDQVLINESGLYKLIFKSRVTEAKEFQNWVTREVLPSIRRTGSYALTETQSETSQLIGAVKDLVLLVRELMVDKIKGRPALPVVPEVSTRLKISQLIRSFVARQTSGYSHQDAFDQLYYQFKYRFNIDLPRRAKNANYTSVMDYAEAQGMTEQVYALACKIFTEI